MIDLVSLNGALGSKGGRGPGAEGRNLDHFCLRIEPFNSEQITDYLADAGIPLLGLAAKNFGAEGYGPSLYVSDPDGNVIELKGQATAVTAERDA